MCYSAEVWADYKKYLHQFPGSVLSIRDFVEIYVRRRSDPKLKLPKGMDLAFLDPRTPEEQQIRTLIDEYNAALITESEQELFKQVKRLADAERKLAVKETKAALNDKRVAGNKVAQLKRWIADAKRAEPEPQRDDRIFPDWYARKRGSERHHMDMPLGVRMVKPRCLTECRVRSVPRAAAPARSP